MVLLFWSTCFVWSVNILIVDMLRNVFLVNHFGLVNHLNDHRVVSSSFCLWKVKFEHIYFWLGQELQFNCWADCSWILHMNLYLSNQIIALCLWFRVLRTDLLWLEFWFELINIKWVIKLQWLSLVAGSVFNRVLRLLLLDHVQNITAQLFNADGESSIDVKGSGPFQQAHQSLVSLVA